MERVGNEIALFAWCYCQGAYLPSRPRALSARMPAFSSSLTLATVMAIILNQVFNVGAERKN